MAEINQREVDFKKAINESEIQYNLGMRELLITGDFFSKIAFYKALNIAFGLFIGLLPLSFLKPGVLLCKQNLILSLCFIIVCILLFYFEYKINKNLDRAKSVLFRIYKIKIERGYIDPLK